MYSFFQFQRVQHMLELEHRFLRLRQREVHINIASETAAGFGKIVHQWVDLEDGNLQWAPAGNAPVGALGTKFPESWRSSANYTTIM